jgi:pyruvate formate lyase activating enzyme
MSTEDGPGIRTTVFFKGCTLACTWCHNPESIAPGAQVMWHGERCIRCGSCGAVCPEEALANMPSDQRVRDDHCVACGTCVDACPSGALDLLGRDWELDALVDEVLKDRAFFASSGGGVTVSGGEPAMQARFVEAFMERLNDQDVHVALDTCGMCALDMLLPLVRRADLVLYDLKEMDPLAHERFTGQANQRILENAVALALTLGEASGDTGERLWIRTPLVPGATASNENIRAVGRFIAERLGDIVSRWDLCAFNNLCREQYARLGLDWAFAERGLMTTEALGAFGEVAREACGRPDIVALSGATATATATATRRISEEDARQEEA